MMMKRLPSNARRNSRCSLAASAAVTRALLLRDYGVSWEARAGALIPPVPQRRAYLDWVRQLLVLCPPPCAQETPPPRPHGLDIGCGASLIFPLLGAAAFGWSWVATETDPGNREWAERAVAANPSLAIEVRAPKEGPLGEVKGHGTDAGGGSGGGGGDGGGGGGGGRGGGALVGAVRPESDRFAFSVCNPPFFSDLAERAGGNPSTAHEGTEAEMVCPGGEVGFVQRLFAESSEAPGMRSAVHWYTTMLGKKSSLKQLRAFLQTRPEVVAVRSTEFALGRTRRWGLAWTFSRAAHGSERTPLVQLESEPTDMLPSHLAGRSTCTFEVSGKSCEGLRERVLLGLKGGGTRTVVEQAAFQFEVSERGELAGLPQIRKRKFDSTAEGHALERGSEEAHVPTCHRPRTAQVTVRSSFSRGAALQIVSVSTRRGLALDWMGDFLLDLDALSKT